MLYSERMSMDGGGYGGGQRTFGLYLLAALRCARTKVVETAQHESVNSLYMELLQSGRMTIFTHSYIFMSQKKITKRVDTSREVSALIYFLCKSFTGQQ